MFKNFAKRTKALGRVKIGLPKRKNEVDFAATELGGGKWTVKTSELIDLYGSLDELNSFIGWSAEAFHNDAQQEPIYRDLLKQLHFFQRELFILSQQAINPKVIGISTQRISELEAAINTLSDKLPALKSFILPGGGEIAARLHIARTVCRRAERVALRAAVKNKSALVAASYLNRLSDWFFVAARTAACSANIEEITV